MTEHEHNEAEDRRGPDHAALPDEELERSLAAERAALSLADHADEWIEQLRNAAAEAVTNLSLDEVIRDALSAIAASLHVDAAGVLLASEDGSELIARAASGLVQEVDLGVRIPAGRGFAGRILASAEPLIVNDLENFEVVSPVLRASELKSMVGVPLLSRGKVVGVMHAGSKTGNRFATRDLEMLELLSYPIATAIERVRLFETERELRETAEVTMRRLAALQQITSELVRARDVEDVCQTIVAHAVSSSAGEDGEPGIWILRDGRLVRMIGGPMSEAYSEIPLDPSLPAAGHLAGEGPLFVETRSEGLARWPALAGTDTHAFAGFPLVVGGERLGVLAIGYRQDHHFDENERAYLTAVAEQAGIALERARAAEAEAAVQGRRSFLAETSIALTNRYATPSQLLDTLVRLALTRLADWCSIMLYRGDHFERVALAYDPDRVRESGIDVAASRVVAENAGLPTQALRSNTTLVLGGAGEPPLVASEYGPVAEALGMTSVMMVPLESHGRAVGVMAFVACLSQPPYRPEDIELAEEFAARAGRLVESLALREREQLLAEALSRALLPASLPRVEGIELVARYLPAEAGPVGGDWYDAFELPENKMGLVVGDVGGHGVEAASAMAKLRNGLVAFASEGHDPPSIFERLSRLLATEWTEWDMPDPIASVLFAVLDRSTLELQITCAGHPPWLLLRDGKAEMHECGGRVLAGSLPAQPLASSFELRRGDVCVFLTDGLVERPDEEMAMSLKRLQAEAEANEGLDLSILADRLVEATTPPGGRNDDCCLLAVRLS